MGTSFTKSAINNKICFFFLSYQITGHLSQFRCRFAARHFGHEHVEKHEIKDALSSQLQCCSSTRHSDNFQLLFICGEQKQQTTTTTTNNKQTTTNNKQTTTNNNNKQQNLQQTLTILSKLLTSSLKLISVSSTTRMRSGGGKSNERKSDSSTSRSKTTSSTIGPAGTLDIRREETLDVGRETKSSMEMLETRDEVWEPKQEKEKNEKTNQHF
jgi:hypothetical protein